MPVRTSKRTPVNGQAPLLVPIDTRVTLSGKLLKKWKLIKIHIHRPAEHLIDDNVPAAYECHLVHFAADDTALTGPKLVIGVFFHKQIGADTPASIRRLSEKLGQRKQREAAPKKWSLEDKGEGLSI